MGPSVPVPEPPSASKDVKMTPFYLNHLGGLMEQLNDCLQHCCSS